MTTAIALTARSSLVSVLWSCFGLCLLARLFQCGCVQCRPLLPALSTLLLSLNLAQVLPGALLLYALGSARWRTRISALNGLVLAGSGLSVANLALAAACLSSLPCGFSQPDAHWPGSGEWPDRVMSLFRYYDLKVVGSSHAMASVGQFTGAMLLALKRNDLRVFARWGHSASAHYRVPSRK